MEGIKEIMAPMIGGDENNSYSQNSSFQKGVIDAAKSLVFEAIGNNIHTNTTTTFRIADLGCSTGPNTLVAVQNIIDAVKCKHKSSAKPLPEFQVFFNDHANNDFNFLFRSLVPNKSLEYYVAGVPGSFYKRLFPKASIHCVHCSYALHWLSKVPEQVRDERSYAWNKGRVFFTGVETEVVEAYSGQFQGDMSNFLKERAEELVDGGLVMIQMPGVPDDEPLITRTTHGLIFNLFEESFMDMVQQGFITEEEMDSFNFPNYFPSIKELKILIKMNSSFDIEHIGALKHPMEDLPFDVEKTTTQMRSVMEGLIAGHFGNRIIDKLFHIFSHKLAENIDTFDNGVRRDDNLSFILRRRARCDMDNLVLE